MNESANIELGNLAIRVLSDLVVGSLAGLGTAFLWFRTSKKELYAEIAAFKEEITHRHDFMQSDLDRRYDKIEVQVSDVWKVLNQNAVQMGVLTTAHANIAAGLEDLKKEGREQNRQLAAIRRGLPRIEED